MAIAKEVCIPFGRSGFRRPPPRGLRGLRHDIRVAPPTLSQLPPAVAVLYQSELNCIRPVSRPSHFCWKTPRVRAWLSS